MTNRRPAGGDERVRELAREGAWVLHCEGIIVEPLNGKHHPPFDTCPHPDCALVRPPAERPADLRELQRVINSLRATAASSSHPKHSVTLRCETLTDWADQLAASAAPPRLLELARELIEKWRTEARERSIDPEFQDAWKKADELETVLVRDVAAKD